MGTVQEEIAKIQTEPVRNFSAILWNRVSVRPSANASCFHQPSAEYGQPEMSSQQQQPQQHR
jgi:hypothetical protein